MKRTLAFVLVVLSLCGILLVPVTAADAAPAQSGRIELEDGSYIVVTVEAAPLARTVLTKSGSKYYTYYSDQDVAQWQIKLSGLFSYNSNGLVPSSCDEASCSVTIYDSHWYVISKSTYPSGNSAVTSVEMGMKTLGVTTFTNTYTVTLTCDNYGNLS